MPAADVVELFDLVDQGATLGFELRTLLVHGRRGVVEGLDLGLEAVAFGLDLGDALARGGEGLGEPLTLALAGGDRPFERLDLGATTGGILADPSTDLLDPAPLLLGFAEPVLGFVELALAQLELGDHASELGLHPRELGIDGVEAGGATRLRSQLLACGGLPRDGCAEPQFGTRAIER